MSEYPTQDFVKAQIKSGNWPAKEGEVLDIRSLSDSEVKILEMYNQEEIIKQLRKLNSTLGGDITANDIIADVNADGYDVDDLTDDVKCIFSKITGKKK